MFHFDIEGLEADEDYLVRLGVQLGPKEVLEDLTTSTSSIRWVQWTRCKVTESMLTQLDAYFGTRFIWGPSPE